MPPPPTSIGEQNEIKYLTTVLINIYLSGNKDATKELRLGIKLNNGNFHNYTITQSACVLEKV